MLALYRIQTVVLRYAQQLVRDPGRMINFLYWPLSDTIVYGYMGIWTEQEQCAGGLGIALLSGTMLWHIVYRANADISFNVMEECWSSNLVNMFATPLQFHEWILGLLSLAAIMLVAIVSFLWILAYLFYGFNFLSIGYGLIPILLNLFLSGVTVGFISAALLFHFGVRIHEVILIIGWIFDPFSGSYYPITVLPLWMRLVGQALPFSYIFNVLRSLVRDGIFDSHSLLIGSCINVCYFMLALVILRTMFHKSLESGLASLSED